MAKERISHWVFFHATGHLLSLGRPIFFHQDGIHHIASCVGIADDLTEPSNRCEIQDIIDKSGSAGGEVRVFFKPAS
jgi:hypothetical protein